MKDTKRQNFPRLWVVATPIGNLEDLSVRARQVLESCSSVLCEDTRRTAQLMAVMGISKPLLRLDAYASAVQIRKIVERLQEGESFALVTDAGTPGISDPASVLVSAAREAGVAVSPVPGPSAVLALLSVSGFGETAFAFRGFFPRKLGEQKRELGKSATSEVAEVFIWFESPERIQETLNLLAQNYPHAQVIVGKELTKIHERFFSAEATLVAQQISQEISHEGTRGEWCFAVHFQKVDSTQEKNLDFTKILQCLLDAGVSASEAARQVSQHFGARKKEIYELALQSIGKKSSKRS